MGIAEKKTVDKNEAYLDELAPGTELLQGQYRIVKFLNAGGFGITYLASDSLDRKVVIKECFPSSFCNRSRTIVQARSRAHTAELRSVVQLFVQEARSLAKLNHPNIVGVHQVFEDNETAYMVLDFVEGRDLLDVLEDPEHGLTPPQIKGILQDVLGAVGFIHEQDILHRDISPDNILLDEDLRPVLIDFGAAREEATKKSRVLSAMRVVKDGYSPQEFYVQGSQQTPSSDLYALGATFYHLIAGEIPPNSQARLAAIASGDKDPYEPLAGNHKGYDTRFLAAVDKALGILPKDRMQSAEDWLDAMEGNRRKSRNVTQQLPKSSAAAASLEPQRSALVPLMGSVAVVAILAVGGLAVTGNLPSFGEDTQTATSETETPDPVTAAVVAPSPSVLPTAETGGSLSDEPTGPVASTETEITQAEEAIIAALTPTPVEVPELGAEPSDTAVVEPEAEATPPVDTGRDAVEARQADDVASVAEPVVEPAAEDAETAETAATEEPEIETAAVAPSVTEEPVETAEAVADAPPPEAPVLPEPPAPFELAGALADDVASSADAGANSETSFTDIDEALSSGRVVLGDASVIAEAPAVPAAIDTVIETSPPQPDVAGPPSAPINIAQESSVPEISLAVVPSLRPQARPVPVALASPERDQTGSLTVAEADIAAPPPVVEKVPAILNSVRFDVPFTGLEGTNEIARAADVAPIWVRPGSRILAVNGVEITDLTQFNSIAATLVPSDDVKSLAVSFMVKPEDDTIASLYPWVLPITYVTQLDNGTIFETVLVNEEWRTTVIAAPDSNGELKVGDIVVGHVETSTQISDAAVLRSVLNDAVENASTQFNFAVMRDGSMWVVPLSYNEGT